VWGVCSGAPLAAKHAPADRWDGRTEDGTAGHWVAAEVLALLRDGTPSACDDYVGQTAENGVVIDAHIAEGAQVYVDDVAEVMDQQATEYDMLIEERVDMPRIHALNWGTLDLSIVSRATATIWLWDYKGGHRFVDARHNLQLIDYVEGLVERLGIAASAAHWFVRFRIVQPFAYRESGPVVEWAVRLPELRPFLEQLKRQAVESQTNPTLTAGLHCRDCPANGRCTTAKEFLYAWGDYTRRPYAMDGMSAPQLATERKLLQDMLSVGKDRLAAIDDDLTARIQTDGGAGTGLALQAGAGREVWRVPYEQVLAFGQQFGADLKKHETITPQQARALVPKALKLAFDSVVKNITKRPVGSLKLIDAADSKTARAFKKD